MIALVIVSLTVILTVLAVTFSESASPGQPTVWEQNGIRKEIDVVAARHRVWGLKEDQRRLVWLRRQLDAGRREMSGLTRPLPGRLPLFQRRAAEPEA